MTNELFCVIIHLVRLRASIDILFLQLIYTILNTEQTLPFAHLKLRISRMPSFTFHILYSKNDTKNYQDFLFLSIFYIMYDFAHTFVCAFIFVAHYCTTIQNQTALILIKIFSSLLPK